MKPSVQPAITSEGRCAPANIRHAPVMKDRINKIIPRGTETVMHAAEIAADEAA